MGLWPTQKRLHQVGRQYTLAEAMASPPHQLAAVGNGEPELTRLAEQLGFHSLWDLASRDLGHIVTDARSSWVRTASANGKRYFIKTYDYRTWRDRLRGALRNTGPTCTSRAAREHAALKWLARAGLAGPRSIGFAERRSFGWVTRCLVVTEGFPGRDLANVLPSEPQPSRVAIALAVGEFVAKLHRLGFRDGNLDLRNLLLADDRARLVIAKIDSPRHRIVRPGSATDRYARADWDRLLPQLRAFGLDDAARAAAAQVT